MHLRLAAAPDAPESRQNFGLVIAEVQENLLDLKNDRHSSGQ